MLLAEMSGIADYKLTDLLGSAGATIGIIIAGTIFRQFLSAKYGELLGRYRELTREYRGGGASELRHSRLQTQIRDYRLRLRLLTYASCVAASALLCFLASVLSGGASMLYPPIEWIKLVGTGALFLGLLQIGIAVSMELYESIRGRHEIGEEVGDLDDEAKYLPN